MPKIDPNIRIDKFAEIAPPAAAFKHQIVRNLFRSTPLWDDVLMSSLDFLENCRTTLRVAFGHLVVYSETMRSFKALKVS